MTEAKAVDSSEVKCSEVRNYFLLELIESHSKLVDNRRRIIWNRVASCLRRKEGGSEAKQK